MAPARPLWLNLIRLARPHQWAKGAFVVVGPVYALATAAPGDPKLGPGAAVAVAGALLAFGFASSACYIVNDIRDAEADRAHPRKKNRPIASGAVSVSTAITFALLLLVAAAASCLLALFPGAPYETRIPQLAAAWLAASTGAYIVNTTLYSIRFKHAAVLDVISLATGFVLRVLGGCAAAGITPSPWLLNCTFFVSMFLAFGKRLGERRAMGGAAAAAARHVQHDYTDELLRMAVVVTGVACLVTYAGYVQAQGPKYQLGFNLLWLTMLPATYGLLRCILLLDRAEYDDPTELATHDRPFQAAAAIFVAITLAVMLLLHPAAATHAG
jgi:decaprenyl-phosphate phosphoribosyltransferase